MDEAFREADRLLCRKPGQGTRTGAVQRRIRRHDWHDLVNAGHAVPLVTVLLLAATEQAIASLEAQDYPRLEVLNLADTTDEACRTNRISHPLIQVPHDGTADGGLWRRILAAANGDILVPLPHGVSWSADRISSDVALLVRNPDLSCSVAEGIRPGGDLLGSVAVRRSAVAAALDEMTDNPAGLEAPLTRILARAGFAGRRLDLPVLRTASDLA